MTSLKSSASASTIHWALAYAAHGLPIFPVAANKEPLTKHGFKDASTDPGVIEALWARWPHADPAWALPETVVVVDLDVKRGRNGLRDFERIAGRNPRAVTTPIASTPSGGLQLFFDADDRTYSNRVTIGGTAVDLRTIGGYVVLPAAGNGREWVRRLSNTPMAPAPDWLACAVKRPPCQRQRPAFGPAHSTIAFGMLRRAGALIIAARRGERDDTRHRQCFLIGALIKDGALDYEVAYRALCACAREMEGASDWPDLDKRVEYSIKRGMEQGDEST
jgi:hypothetical protein